MATTTDAVVAGPETARELKPTGGGPPGGRLISLDAFRGLTMLLLVSHGFGMGEAFKGNQQWQWLARQFDHVAWEGCVFWDLIMPAFTFIVGVAMPLSIARRAAQGASRAALFGHVLWRALMLVVLSNIFSNWGARELKLQFVNVLCQIAFAYVICYLILQLRFLWQVAAALGLIVLHTGSFYLFPGPAGPFDPAGNIGMVLDKAILGYNYSGYYTTYNFLGNAITILFGAWTGLLMQSKLSHGRRLRILAVAMVACFAAGLALAPVIPMVKRIWTVSFTLYSTGWVLAGLIACYWMIEMKGWKRWAFPAVVVGMNSIFIYGFSQILRGWLSRGLAAFTFNFSFLGQYGAIPHNLVVMAVMWYLCYWLYQRKIYFRI